MPRNVEDELRHQIQQWQKERDQATDREGQAQQYIRVALGYCQESVETRDREYFLITLSDNIHAFVIIVFEVFGSLGRVTRRHKWWTSGSYITQRRLPERS